MELVNAQTNKDQYKTSRFLFIVEATLEYFISMLVGGAYLAKVTSAIGLNDTITGILSSFVSLGCGFQIIAIFLANKRPVKRWVTILHSINQLAFALIYIVPFINIGKTGKTIIFIIFLLAGHIINNVVNSPKINWFMALVDDKKRGRFTANKEMTSLISGIIFSYAAGSVVDYFDAAGNQTGAFIALGIAVLVLMLSHTATLVFSKEKPIETAQKLPIKTQMMELLKDKNLFKVILIPTLWTIVSSVSTPFYGSYQIKELGFTMTFVSVLSIITALVRTCFSRPLGKYADKNSFAKMLNICYVVMLVAFIIKTFTVPANGKILYPFYSALYGIAMAGINSSVINLIYDYVSHEKRMSALALSSTMSGFSGFFATLAISPLVTYIQNNNNTLLGIHVYAQQVVSVISVILLLLLIVYLNTVVRKLQLKANK